MALKSHRDRSGVEVVQASGKDKAAMLGAFRELTLADHEKHHRKTSKDSPFFAMPARFLGFTGDGHCVYDSPEGLADPVPCGDGWIEGTA